MMRISAIVAAVWLCGCQSYEPRESPWESLSVDSAASQQPVALPERPEPETLTHDGTEYVAFDGEGRSALLAYLEAAEANTDIARENAHALDRMHQAYDSAVRAGQAEYELAELRGRLLFEERQADIWGVLGGFGRCFFLGAIGGATQ